MLLLSTQAPGRSPHAKVFLDQCDDACQSNLVCKEEKLFCRAPKFSARDKRWYRYESWTEGVRRYALLADVVVDLAASMTWHKHATCPPPGRGASTQPACRRLYRERPWSGNERHLERLLVTVMSHESALRRDIHSGYTRGDCDYTTIGGKQTVVVGSCRSHCLGQVQVPRGRKTKRGYTSEDLVGIDRASTERCLETVIDVLAGARNACVRQNHGREGAYPACTMGLYGGVAGWSGDPRIAARAKTYHTLSYRARNARPLRKAVLSALGR